MLQSAVIDGHYLVLRLAQLCIYGPFDGILKRRTTYKLTLCSMHVCMYARITAYKYVHLNVLNIIFRETEVSSIVFTTVGLSETHPGTRC